MSLYTEQKTQKYIDYKFKPASFTIIDEITKTLWGQALNSISIPKNGNPYKCLLDEAPKIAREFMPTDLLRAIASIKQPCSSPYRLLSNLPIDYPLTGVPIDGKRPSWKKSWVSEGVLIGIASALELEPLSYLQEKEGLLVHEVAPIPGQESQLSNSGRISLGFHTDHAILHRRYRPEFLMLLGLVNPGQTPTLIACLDDALEKLALYYKDVLRQPKFRIEMPDSVCVWNGKKLLSEWKPLLTNGCSGEAEIAGNLHSVRPMDKEAEQALQAFINVLTQVAQEIILEPGMLLLFDNHRCLHARNSVKQERWLQRLFCCRSLTNLRQVETAVTSSSYIFDMQTLLLE